MNKTNLNISDKISITCIVAFIICAFFTPYLTGTARASTDEDSIKALASKTAAFFKPLNLHVKEVKGNHCSIGIGDTNFKGHKGLRLDILREGEMFYHPLTNEPLGHFEKNVGLVEISEISGNTVICKILTGKPKPSDIARVSSSKIRALFYQDKSIDWFVGDAFYRAMKEGGRFDLIDTSINPAKTEAIMQLLAEAGKKDAEVLLYVSGKSQAGGITLSERLFWVAGGEEIFSDSTVVNDSYAKGLRTASDIFVTSNDEPLLTYSLSSGYEMLAVGDVAGDGKEQLLLANSGKVAIYQPTVDLHELWSITADKFSDFIYVSTVDLNKNGKDEVILSSLSTNGAYSYVYELVGNEMVQLWKTSGFLRVSQNRLLYQSYDNINGFTGPVLNVTYTPGASVQSKEALKEELYKPGKPIDLPTGVNIYDFEEINAKDSGGLCLYYDKHNHLNLSSREGVAAWRSKEDFGGFQRQYKKPSLADMIDGGYWYMGDKLYSIGQQAFTVRRIPITSTMLTLGYKRSEIVDLWFNGVSMDESILVKNISGNILDYAIYKDRIYVLVKPILGFDASNIVKGKNPVITKMFVYPFTR